MQQLELQAWSWSLRLSLMAICFCVVSIVECLHSLVGVDLVIGNWVQDSQYSNGFGCMCRDTGGEEG